MKQRWSRKQIEDKVNMFTRHVDKRHEPADETSLHFFTEKLFVMDVKQTKSITIETEQLFNLHGE